MRIVITGASGNLGSTLVRRLGNDDHELVGISRRAPDNTGWLDLGFASPLLDTTRASQELGWSPSVDGVSVFREIVGGMRDTASDDTPVLRRRSVAGSLRDAVRRGPVSARYRP